MPLHIDYRPKDFDEIVGNAATVKAIQTVLNRENKDWPHAWLLHGPSGTGKTTLGYIIAKHLGCPPSSMDFDEIDNAQQTGIDTARTIRQNMRYLPTEGTVRVYLLDEVHRASKNFQDGMLKATESPPKHVYFILCTTEPNKIIPTLRKRCMPFATEKSSTVDLERLALEVLESEGVDIAPDVLAALVKSADGAPRDLLVNMDKILDLEPGDMLAAIESTEARAQTIDLCRALLKKQPWSSVTAILKSIDDDPERIRLAINGYMAAVLLKGNNINAQALFVMSCFERPNHYNGRSGLIAACAQVYIK